jgi:hypothetical protein
MKLFFLLLFVVLLWSNNNALQCIDYTGERLFEVSDLTEVKEFIDKLDTSEGYEVCSIVYGILYPRKTFIVAFGEGIGDFQNYVNMDVFFKILLFITSNGTIVDPASGQKLFLFTCNDQDACERQFWRDHIDWFIREESTIFERAFRLILITENKEKGKIDTHTQFNIQLNT